MQSLGGMTLINTPVQRLNGIHDNPEIALRTGFPAPNSQSMTTGRGNGPSFMSTAASMISTTGSNPRGSSSSPFPTGWKEASLAMATRYPVTTSSGVPGSTWCARLSMNYKHHANSSNITYLFDHKVESLVTKNQSVCGLQGSHEITGQAFEVDAAIVLVASGGINGDINRVKEEWDQSLGSTTRAYSEWCTQICRWQHP